MCVQSTTNKKAKAIVRDRLRLYAQLGEDQSWQPDEAKRFCSIKNLRAFLPAGFEKLRMSVSNYVL
jgi:hypothetical protein